MRANDWKVIDLDRAMRKADQIGLRATSKAKLLRDTALKLFRLG